MNIRAGFVAGLALCALGAPVADGKPLKGTVSVSAQTADPDGGAPWAVRTWQAKAPGFGDPEPRWWCAQAGRLVGGKMVRRFAASPDIALGFADRSFCGEIAKSDYMPLSIERLVADPRAPQAGPVRTIVSGIAPKTAQGLVLTVAGVPRTLVIAPTSRAFLAVLPGAVKRADLVLTVQAASGRTHVFDYGRGARVNGSLVAGSVRREATAPDPTGGLPLALVAFGLRTVGYKDQIFLDRCFEPTRVVGSEVGAYEPRFGSFLDAPTLDQQSRFEDTWMPAGPMPAETGSSCTSSVVPARGAIDAVGARRLGPGLVAVHGLLPTPRSRLVVRGHRAIPAPAAVAADGAFLVPVRSRGRFGERLRLTAVTPGRRPRSRVVHLGAHDVGVQQVGTFATGRGGRLLRLDWIGGLEDYSGVRVKQERKRVVVRIFERSTPDFSPEGLGYLSPLIGIFKCVQVKLGRPLGRRAVVDATTKRRLTAKRGPIPKARRCARAHKPRVARAARP